MNSFKKILQFLIAFTISATLLYIAFGKDPESWESIKKEMQKFIIGNANFRFLENLDISEDDAISYVSTINYEDISINGEYYCSMVYNLMVNDSLEIGIYEIEYFMQWGLHLKKDII